MGAVPLVGFTVDTEGDEVESKLLVGRPAMVAVKTGCRSDVPVPATGKS